MTPSSRQQRLSIPMSDSLARLVRAHGRFLETRGLAERTSEGYRITEAGAELVEAMRS